MSAEQKALADTLVIIVGIGIYIFRVVLAVLLLVLIIKAIKYFNNKNKNKCEICIYKQRCIQHDFANENSNLPIKDG